MGRAESFLQGASHVTGGTGHAVGAFGGGVVSGYQWARQKQWGRNMSAALRTPSAEPAAAEAEAGQTEAKQVQGGKPAAAITSGRTPGAENPVTLFSPTAQSPVQSTLKSGLDSVNGRSQLFAKSASGGGQNTPVRGSGGPSVPDRAADLARLGIKPHAEVPEGDRQAQHKHVLPLMSGTYGTANAAAAWTKPGDGPMPISTATIGSTFTPSLSEGSKTGTGWPGGSGSSRSSGLGWPG